MANFEVVFDVEGDEVHCTYENTQVVRYLGSWSVCDCINYTGNENRQVIFESEEEQNLLFDYGWLPVIQEHPDEGVIHAYYIHRGFEPEQRN